MEPGSKPVTVQSVHRAISILRCFTDTPELGLTEISKLVGLHKSTTAGIVNTLKAEGFLEQNRENGRFRLGMDLLRLAGNAGLELKDICQPHLDELLRATGETVNLGVQAGDAVVYIEKKESSHSMRICTSVGQRQPLYCTAIGKALLAFFEEKELERTLNRIELVKHTAKTITDRAELKKALEKVRERGIAYDDEELEYGLICMAAPILNRQGSVVGAVSVSGPSIRMNASRREKIALELKKAVGNIRRDIVDANISHI